MAFSFRVSFDLKQLALGASLSLFAGVLCADVVNLKADSPEQYTVKKGDTLWDISGKYLSDPSKWPTLWSYNKQIADPHWIYPGDVLVLDKTTGKLRIKTKNGNLDNPNGQRPDMGGFVPTLPDSIISAFLRQPVMLTENEYKSAPAVIAGQESRVLFSQGDTVYTNRLPVNGVWQIIKGFKPIKDVDTGEILAYEAMYVGSAEVERGVKNTSVLTIQDTLQEVSVGDRLVKYNSMETTNFTPHPVSADMKGKIVAIHGATGQLVASSFDNLVINRGRKDGVEAGHVYGVYKAARTVKTSDAAILMEEQDHRSVTIPPEQIGTMMVYRVYDKVAYGISFNMTRQVVIGDEVAKAVQ
jgi:LysM repeat protein